MKLIHCADLHLDSPMESNLPTEKAKERKSEILATFAKLVRIADENGVSAILIAGDLFDSNHITKKTEKYVLELIASHPNLAFFYLAGNHDRGNTLRISDERPENLYTFEDGWTSYDFGDLVITGSERPDPEALVLSESALNIVLMHGQQRTGGARGAEEDIIRFTPLKNKHIDYLALGHIHEYRPLKLDERAIACYAGCLEGRGFDECGQKGYVLLEVDGRHVKHRFVPIARRTLHTVECEISDFSSQLDLEERVLAAVRDIPTTDLVKVLLTGACPAEAQKDVDHLTAVLSERFYFAKIYDKSRVVIRPEDYRHDVSLKGEFVRRVMASDLSEAEKERVIVCGFRALTGEEVGL